MKTKIQNNIKENDLAYEISFKLKFKSNISDSIMLEIDGKLNKSLLNLGVGFTSAHGLGFLQAGLLNFGKKPSFKDAKETINLSLQDYQNYIEQIEFNKSEFLISNINFIGEKFQNFEKTTRKLKNLYPELKFNNIEKHIDSPETKSIYCIANDKSVMIWMSQITIEGNPFIRISIGSRCLTKKEVQEVKRNLNNVVCKNIEQIKWNGLHWDYEKEIWCLPTNRNLYEKFKEQEKLPIIKNKYGN